MNSTYVCVYVPFFTAETWLECFYLLADEVESEDTNIWTRECLHSACWGTSDYPDVDPNKLREKGSSSDEMMTNTKFQNRTRKWANQVKPPMCHLNTKVIVSHPSAASARQADSVVVLLRRTQHDVHTGRVTVVPVWKIVKATAECLSSILSDEVQMNKFWPLIKSTFNCEFLNIFHNSDVESVCFQQWICFWFHFWFYVSISKSLLVFHLEVPLVFLCF